MSLFDRDNLFQLSPTIVNSITEIQNSTSPSTKRGRDSIDFFSNAIEKDFDFLQDVKLDSLTSQSSLGDTTNRRLDFFDEKENNKFTFPSPAKESNTVKRIFDQVSKKVSPRKQSPNKRSKFGVDLTNVTPISISEIDVSSNSNQPVQPSTSNSSKPLPVGLLGSSKYLKQTEIHPSLRVENNSKADDTAQPLLTSSNLRSISKLESVKEKIQQLKKTTQEANQFLETTKEKEKEHEKSLNDPKSTTSSKPIPKPSASAINRPSTVQTKPVPPTPSTQTKPVPPTPSTQNKAPPSTPSTQNKIPPPTPSTQKIPEVQPSSVSKASTKKPPLHKAPAAPTAPTSAVKAPNPKATSSLSITSGKSLTASKSQAPKKKPVSQESSSSLSAFELEWEKKVEAELLKGGTGGIGIRNNFSEVIVEEPEENKPKSAWSPVKKRKGPISIEDICTTCSKKVNL